MEYRVFRNCVVVAPDGLLKGRMVVIRDGRIESIPDEGDSNIPPGARITDAKGLYLAPGFIDLHVHGGDGADFMDARPAAIDRIFRYHARHGSTSLCPTTATAPAGEILDALDAIADYRASGEKWGRALGAHIEGPYLAMTKRGCHLPEHVRNPSPKEWRILLERGKLASMTLAPELDGARALVEALEKKGAIASAGHSEALYHEMNEA
ncbi:MAG: N-acetylglucosamine-6-phosphate deacetylase, partial [Bryobacteraceae bacterium]